MFRSIITATAVAATSLIVTAAPAQAMGIDPDARIRVASQTDGSGRTEVRVVLDNTASTSKVTGEVVVKNTKTGKWSSQYVTVPRRETVTRYYYLTEGQARRFTVSYFDATAAAKKVTALVPTTPYARHTKSECYGVGDLVTLLYGNPTRKAKTFVTTLWLGDGTGKITKRVSVPAKARSTVQYQIGNAPADTWTRLANGTDVASFQIGTVC